jgi:hypothetical protein
MALLVELMRKLDKGYEHEEQERVSFQRELVLWGINQPESELRDQLADASERVKRCEEQRTSCLVEMIRNPQERVEILKRERQNCLMALQARQFFQEFGQSPEFEEFIFAVV